MDRDPGKGFCVFRDGVYRRNRVSPVSDFCTAGHDRTAQPLDDNKGLAAG